MNKIRTDTGKDIREIEKKHGRVRYFGGGRTKLLEELGIPKNSKWICIHNRDSSYLNKIFLIYQMDIILILELKQ